MPGVATSSNKFAISPYIVDSVAGNGASYTTIASAIAAALAAGGGSVYIKPGVYTEDLVLSPTVTLEGAAPEGRGLPGAAPAVIIDGHMTITAAGLYGIKNIGLQRTAAGNLFEVTNAAGAAFILISNCSFAPSAGIAINLASGAGASAGMIADLCEVTPSAGAIGVQAVRGSYFMNSGVITASGAAAAVSLGVGALLRAYNHADITGGTSAIDITDATASAELDDSVLTGGTASALVFTAAGAISMYHSRVTSSGGGGDWASGAAGTLNYSSVINLGTDITIAAGLTQSQKNWQQYAASAAAAVGSVRGTASFNSAEFTVADGWVSLVGSAFIPWSDLAPGAMTLNNGYFATGAGAYTLPPGTADGQTIEIVDVAGGGVVVTAAGVQLINVGNVVSSAGGTATSTAKGDALRLKFRLSDVSWYQAPGSQGIWTLA